jgi:translation initiation factor IF-3
MDEQIKSPEARVIDEDGKQVGIIPISEALAMARDKDLNLVEVSPEAKPPVCKIMDFGKFKYQQKKKDHKAKQKQHQVVVKEIRVRPKTDKHDIETKIRIARGFLEKGNKVQVNMLFRGREMMHLEVGKQVMNTILEALIDLSKVERLPTLEGRRMVMMLSSK